MKFTIEITEQEAIGIKQYLIETDGDLSPKVGKKEIQDFIQGIVSGSLNAPQDAVSDYIRNAVVPAPKKRSTKKREPLVTKNSFGEAYNIIMKI